MQMAIKVLVFYYSRLFCAKRTNCVLSAGGASVMDFRSSTVTLSMSSMAEPEYSTTSFTKMLMALSMKDTNRCMWM